MSWMEVEFETLYSDPSKNGLTRPARVRGSGYKMINMGELFAYDRIGNVEMERVLMNEKELATMLVETGDLLFARQSLVLAGAGKCSLVRELEEPTTFESHIIRVRLNRIHANPVFFHYYFKSPTCRIRSIVTQGVQAGIRGNELKKLKVQLPSLREQDRIAAILSAYDDLIENNRRRIQLLEQAARLLYKEWFVHLRFPGHEHTKIINGIPEGWKNGCVGDLATVKSGFAFKSKDWQQDGNPVIKIKNIVGDGTIDTVNCDCVNDNVAEAASDFEIPVGMLLIAMTGATVGKVGIMPESIKKFFLNQRVGFFKSISAYPIERFLYPFFQGGFAQTQVQNLASGAAQPNISGGQLESIELLIPDNKIILLYLDTTEGIFQQRQNLLNQNIKLSEARDLLLPRLMNGAIAV